ncbi:hypothetical protein DB347_12775 [Opitutaceae bacterium EW11]|nr:hypothetical protein DB347_12775 [Opitutaceae bacterium EW11]
MAARGLSQDRCFAPWRFALCNAESAKRLDNDGVRPTRAQDRIRRKKRRLERRRCRNESVDEED